ncbi:MAG: sugar transferase [Bacteroidota bacterium]|nr:sugar transferase [Bacteroidota bacterium]
MSTINRELQILKYVLLDLLSAMLAWTSFFIWRKYIIDPSILERVSEVATDTNLYIGLTIIPLFWLFSYYIGGTYRRIYHKSRLKELGQTLLITLIGVTIIFFVLILDDIIISYKSYYRSFFTLFTFHFGFTYFFRLTLTSITNHKIHTRKIGFNTLIVGSNGNAIDIFQQIENQEKSTGQIFRGFVNVYPYKKYKLEKHLPYFGFYKDLNKIIREHKIEEIIIATEKSENDIVENIISELEDTNIIIKIIPKMHDIFFGSVRMGAIFETPLIQISPRTMPVWQQSLKRFIDIVASIVAIILLSPIYIACAIGVKLSSTGPIIFSQERIGIRGSSFRMHKFRSMYENAEKGTPQLSSDNDPRITKFGLIMRKTRMDELPQFFTVLKGDMSIVGPRPERQYFIDLIVERAPHYRMLQRIKPGITSWGQVKYGYASDVDEMVTRLKYDILYLENMSIAMDFKILIYTAIIVLQGRGK